MTLEENINRYKEKIQNCNSKVYEFIYGVERYKQEKKEYTQLINWLHELQKARVLLKTTYDFLKTAEKNPYVKDVLSMLIYYDGEICDGYCLMDDIKKYFDEFDPERRTDE